MTCKQIYIFDIYVIVDSAVICNEKTFIQDLFCTGESFGKQQRSLLPTSNEMYTKEPCTPIARNEQKTSTTKNTAKKCLSPMEINQILGPIQSPTVCRYSSILESK